MSIHGRRHRRARGRGKQQQRPSAGQDSPSDNLPVKWRCGGSLDVVSDETAGLLLSFLTAKRQ